MDNVSDYGSEHSRFDFWLAIFRDSVDKWVEFGAKGLNPGSTSQSFLHPRARILTKGDCTMADWALS